MPLYEYDCPVCGRVEVMHKISDPALKQCPTCKEAGRKSKVTRVVSPSAFHLKGTGWYKTDYAKSGSSTASAPSASSSSPSSANTTAEKSESTDKTGSEKKGNESKPSSGDGGSSSH